jgi:hypothetical protein
VEAKTMTKRSVDDLYGGRSFPHGRLRDGSHRHIESEPSLEPKGGAFNRNDVQDVEDRHDNSKTARYDNQVADNWLRGGHEDATSKPGYDHDPVWKRANKGDTWNSPGDRTEFVKPERVTVNAKQRRND